MKKLYIATLILIITLPSCDPDKAICYNCTKGSDYSNFCLPRADAKDKKEGLERNGYSCSKQ